jgi:hypothetical protein
MGASAIGLFFVAIAGVPHEAAPYHHEPLIPPPSVQARMLIEGDVRAGMNLIGLDKEADCRAWLNWALLRTEKGSKGRQYVLAAIGQFNGNRGCVACLRYLDHLGDQSCGIAAQQIEGKKQ